MCFLWSLVAKCFSFLLRLFLYRKSMVSTNTNRSSCWQMFFKIVVKNFTIFTGKDLRWSLFLRAFRPAALLKTDSNTDVFCEYCEVFKNNFFYRTLLVAASEQTKNHNTFWNKGKYIGLDPLLHGFQEKTSWKLHILEVTNCSWEY